MKSVTTLLLYNPSTEVRGKMRRYFYEVKPNVFVGTVSASVRNNLWGFIENKHIEASMITHTNNEQGFEYKTTKANIDYCFDDFDGIVLPTSINTSLLLNEIYAKPDYHLIDHILDVGYVAEALMKYGRAYTMVQSIVDETGIDFETVVSSICWLCALHDIGKAHPNFIGKMYPNYENLIDLYNDLKERGLLTNDNCNNFRHERYSRTILENYFKNNEYPRKAKKFAHLVAYHHQGKIYNNFDSEVNCKIEEYSAIHNQIIEEVSQIWSFDKDFSNCYTNGVMYSTLSIMITADWIASGTMWYSKVTSDKRESAKRFIEDNQLSYTPMLERFKGVEWNDVFAFEQNDLQKTVISLAKENPQLMIVEYPCGGGKTEASLVASVYMGRNKSGIYMAMPTMSTARNMTLRMNEIANPLGIKVPEFDSSVVWSNEDLLKIPKYLWTSKSRHKMLYPFAVGTIDQILKIMLYTRYAGLELVGLSDKVIVIDEVHAYDSYMLTEIKMLLEWAKFLHIPVILLSATLPTITKQELLMASGCSRENLPNSNEYPLITTYNNGECKCTPVACKGRDINIQIIETNDIQETYRNELSKYKTGCIAFIGSTVDKTWEIFRTAQELDLKPFMFNGRDTLSNKEHKIEMLIDTLGKKKDHRPEYMCLTATSIIEQSLDIDLDRMCTFVAPIDLLIQRFGRVWRHSDIGTIREVEHIDTPISIIIPISESDLPTKIYDKQVLTNTIKELKEMTTINTVIDARRLIDSVYNSKGLIDNLSKNIRANIRTIESPYGDTMFDNNNTQYARFEPNRPVTRDADYPTVQMAIVTPEEVTDVDFNKVRHIMLNKTVVVACYKLEQMGIPSLDTPHEWLDEVQLYDEETLRHLGICITEDGLVWYNN